MRHRHQGGKEGEGGEPAAAVRPDHTAEGGEHETRIHGGTDAGAGTEAL